MATRGSDRNDERTSARSARGGATNPSATRNQGAASGARAGGGAGAGAGAGARQSATAAGSGTSTSRGSSGSTANAGTSGGAGSATAGASQQPRGAGNQNQSASNLGTQGARSDQERELRTSREQGARPSSSAQRGDIGEQNFGYPSPFFAMGGGSPFAMMRRMMDDMDRLFSDFGFAHPSLLASSVFDPSAWSTNEPQRAIGGQASSGGTRGSLAQPRGQSLQRSGQRGLQPFSLQNIWSPQVEIFERDNNFVVRADLPGLSRDDVAVEVEDDALVIRGERRNDFEEQQEGYYRSERSYGSFYRAIPLPEGAEAGEANATFKDGVLEVTLPKPQRQAQGRKIEVK